MLENQNTINLPNVGASYISLMGAGHAGFRREEG